VKVVDPSITSVPCPGSLGQQLRSAGWENNILQLPEHSKGIKWEMEDIT
jgi:hypothetical protein